MAFCKRCKRPAYHKVCNARTFADGQPIGRGRSGGSNYGGSYQKKSYKPRRRY